MTCREALRMYARIKGVPRAEIEAQLTELLTDLSLDRFADKQASHCYLVITPSYLVITPSYPRQAGVLVTPSRAATSLTLTLTLTLTWSNPKQACQLSGGNKRKLCVGIAMMGKP
eukprot:scaffold68234_cov36-Phaeocystis_antarctica.AAC.1